jgi:hypothetical protein
MTRKRKIARRIGHRFSPANRGIGFSLGPHPPPAPSCSMLPPASADQVLHACRKDAVVVPEDLIRPIAMARHLCVEVVL